MSIILQLPAELEERLRREAERRGVAPDACAAEVLAQHLPLPPTAPLTQDEAVRRIREAKTLEELFEVYQSLPPDDDGYDLLEALNENRRLSGDVRMLFPPEMKGISW